MAASTLQHPFAPAGGCAASRRVRRRGALPRPAGGGGARGAHRPYSRNAGRPVSSRAAPSATSRSNSRRAARSVIGAWRAASAGETQSSASSRSTIFDAGLARSLGATAMRVSARRERSAARSRADAAASAIAPSGVLLPSGVSRPRAPPSPVRSQAGIQNSRRDQRHGPRPAQPDRQDQVERPRGRGFRLRPPRRPGRRRTPGRRSRPLPRPDRPPLRKLSGWMRGRSGPRPGRAAPRRRRAGPGRGWAAGRRDPARAEEAARLGRRHRWRSAGRGARLGRR